MARGAHRREIRGPAVSYSASDRSYMNGPLRARLSLRRRLLRCSRTEASLGVGALSIPRGGRQRIGHQSYFPAGLLTTAQLVGYLKPVTGWIL
jgi:hypothetical protein